MPPPDAGRGAGKIATGRNGQLWYHVEHLNVKFFGHCCVLLGPVKCGHLAERERERIGRKWEEKERKKERKDEMEERLRKKEKERKK